MLYVGYIVYNQTEKRLSLQTSAFIRYGTSKRPQNGNFIKMWSLGGLGVNHSYIKGKLGTLTALNIVKINQNGIFFIQG